MLPPWGYQGRLLMKRWHLNCMTGKMRSDGKRAFWREGQLEQKQRGGMGNEWVSGNCISKLPGFWDT